MGIIRPQFFEINWSYCDKAWYVSRGYGPPELGKKFTVSVDDLPLGSGKKVDVECDYCGKRFKRVYQTLFDGRHTNVAASKKIACANCQKSKSREIVQQVYGVNHPMQLPSTIEKIKQLNREKYGVDWAIKNKNVKEKVRKTCFERYGVNAPMQSAEIKEKSKQTSRKHYGVDHPMKSKDVVNKLFTKLQNRTSEQKKTTIKKREATNIKKYGVPYAMLLPKNRERMHVALYEQGKAPSSTQQRVLCSVLNGKLNYPVSNLFLDIAWPECMVYMEYDGSGHEYRVTRGECTHEQFVLHELKRDKFLAKCGWRRIRMVAVTDLLPDVDWLVDIVDKFIANSNATWLLLTVSNNMVVADSNLSLFKWSALVSTTTVKQMKKQEATNG